MKLGISAPRLATFGAGVLAAFFGFHSAAQTNLPRPAEGWREVDPDRVHDPSTIVECNNEYWLFATGPGIISRRSKDLVTWTNGPRVFSKPPAWTTNSVPGNRGYFWAPDVVHLTNGYFLYYSVSTWGKKTSAIGLATNPTLDPSDPNYNWTDRGTVLSTSNADDHNAIDPSVMLDTQGQFWMAYGSYWSGIKLVQLDPQTGKRAATNSLLYSVAWHESIEAAALHQHGKYYYLFVNWGQCCRGTNSTYEIRVGRSQTVTGPYVDRDGTDLLKGGGSLFLATSGNRIGPGHAAFLTQNDNPFVSFHYYDAQQRGRPRLQILPLLWTGEGWPEAGQPIVTDRKR